MFFSVHSIHRRLEPLWVSAHATHTQALGSVFGDHFILTIQGTLLTDRDSGLVHSVVSTAANISDLSQTAKLLHRQENQVNGDGGHVGIKERKEILAEDPNGRIDWQIPKKRGAIKRREEGSEKELIVAEEKAKASVRAFVEHPFHIFKNLFRHRKPRYR